MLTPGSQLGRYQVLGKLASGGMAVVYLARQQGPAGFQKVAVIKQILPHLAENRQFLEMFLNEARLAALINHPHAVQIFELGGVEEEAPWLAMEFIEGKTLARVLKLREGQPLLFPLAARILADAASALHHAHESRDSQGNPLGIVHRDVTPENVLISYSGQVKVVDFGIAKATTSTNLTQTGSLKGKIAFMAPEQVRGEPLDRRTDVFALGVILYLCLTGRRPFTGNSELEIFQRILGEPHPPVRECGQPVPEELAKVVDTCLSKDRAERFSTALEVQEALERYLSREGGGTAYALSQYLGSLVPADQDPDRLRVADILSEAARAPLPPPVQELPLEAQLTMLERSEKKKGPPALAPPVDELATRIVGASTPLREDGPTLVLGETAAPEPSLLSRFGMPIAVAVLVTVVVSVALALRPARTPNTHVDPVPAQPTTQSIEEAPPPIEVTDEPVAELPKTEVAIEVPKAEPEPTNAVRAPDHKRKTTRRREPRPRAAQAAEPALLRVNAPRPGELFIDGKRRGAGTVIEVKLPPGKRSLRLRGTNWEVRRVIELAAGESRVEEVTPRKGKLHVRVAPWARVRVDGEELGTTPLEPRPLDEGPHQVELINPDLGVTRTVSVRIRAGETSVLKVRLDEP